MQNSLDQESRGWGFCPGCTVNNPCDLGQRLFLVPAGVTIFRPPHHNYRTIIINILEHVISSSVHDSIDTHKQFQEMVLNSTPVPHFDNDIEWVVCRESVRARSAQGLASFSHGGEGVMRRGHEKSSMWRCGATCRNVLEKPSVVKERSFCRICLMLADCIHNGFNM